MILNIHIYTFTYNGNMMFVQPITVIMNHVILYDVKATSIFYFIHAYKLQHMIIIILKL